jgi:hypothetical protein
MAQHRIAFASDALFALRKRGPLAYQVARPGMAEGITMQVAEVRSDPDPFDVEPGAFANPVSRVNRRRFAGRLSA